MIPARDSLLARPSASCRPSWIGLGMLLALAFALRFFRLGWEGLWVDEAFTAQLVRLAPARILEQLLGSDDAPPLFYFVEKIAAALFGTGETALRLAPALAGFLAPALLLLCARARGRANLLWSGAFLSVAAYGVFYSRQARSYGLVLLLGLLFVLASQALLSPESRTAPVRESRRAAAWVAISGTLLVCTHHLAGLLLMTGALLALVRLIAERGQPAGETGGPRARGIVAAFAIPLLAWGLLLLLSRSQIETHAIFNAWMGEFWKRHPLPLAPLFSLGVFSPGGRCPLPPSVSFAVLHRAYAFWSCLSFALGVSLLVLAIAPAFSPRTPKPSRDHDPGRNAPDGSGQSDSQPASPDQKRVLALVLSPAAIETAFLALPLLALLAASMLFRPAYVLGRSDAIAFPAFALLMGRGLARLPRAAAGAAVVFWLLVSLAALSPTYGWAGQSGGVRHGLAGWQAKGNDRRLAEDLVRQGFAAGDRVIHTYLTAPSLEYYLDHAGIAHGKAWFPAEAGAAPAATALASFDSLRAHERQAIALRRMVERDLPHEGSVWILALASGDESSRVNEDPGARTLTLDDLAYPQNLLLFYFSGTAPQPAALRYTQDWISGRRLVVRVPKQAFVPLESLPPVEAGSPETRR